MKTLLKSLFAAAVIALPFTGLMAENASSDKKPYSINGSYLIAFAPSVSSPGLVAPTGPVTVIDEAEGWVKIQYVVSKNARNASDPGKVEAVETTYKAWVNLDHITAFVEAPAKP